jgi:hypothetical protein
VHEAGMIPVHPGLGLELPVSLVATLCGHDAGVTPIAPPDSLSAHGISRKLLRR